MFKIIHSLTPCVGTTTRSTIADGLSYEDAESLIHRLSDGLLVSQRSFTYDPGRRRLSGERTSLPLLVANQGERWYVEQSV